MWRNHIWRANYKLLLDFQLSGGSASLTPVLLKGHVFLTSFGQLNTSEQTTKVVGYKIAINNNY